MSELKTISPLEGFRASIKNMSSEFGSVLPAQIPVDKFIRTTVTAVQMAPDLLEADRKSLFAACMKAAQDGLLCDGREAALVIYNTKVDNKYIKAVQYLPMVGGILKKLRNSGEVSTVGANVVYANDQFKYWFDNDGEHIEHTPQIDGDRGAMRLVYAFAKLKDGSMRAVVMTKSDVEKVRNASRSKDGGPWSTWYDEMAKKSAIRRLSKHLPMSSDIEGTLRADDEDYDFAQPIDVTPPVIETQTLAGKMAAAIEADTISVVGGAE